MEKAIYHYKGDASRLCDVTRETIVFETPKQIATCLQAMEHDPEIRLVSVRNTLDPRENASWSAGYKAVFVKLRIENAVSHELAVAAHVCEVILTLRAIAEGVSAESYEDYLLLKRLQDEQLDLLGHGHHHASGPTAVNKDGLRSISLDWGGAASYRHRFRGGTVVPYPSVAPVLSTPSPHSTLLRSSSSIPPLGADETLYNSNSTTHIPLVPFVSAPAEPEVGSRTTIASSEHESGPANGAARAFEGPSGAASSGEQGKGLAAGGGVNGNGHAAGLSKGHGVGNGNGNGHGPGDVDEEAVEGSESGGGKGSVAVRGEAELTMAEDGEPPVSMSGGGFGVEEEDSMAGLGRGVERVALGNGLGSGRHHSEGNGNGHAELESGGGRQKPKVAGWSVESTELEEGAGGGSAADEVEAVRGSGSIVARARRLSASALASLGQGLRFDSEGSLGSAGVRATESMGSAAGGGRRGGRRSLTVRIQSDKSLTERQAALQEHLLQVFLQQYRRRTTLEGGDLDQWWVHLGKATASAHFAQVFNVSFPITSALSKRWFLYFSLIIGFACLALAVQYMRGINLFGVVALTHLRFSAIELRGGPGVQPTGPVVGGLGLMRYGCKEPLHWLVNGSLAELVVDLGGRTELDGVYFETSGRSPAEDPVVFEFMGKRGAAADWEVVGSSRKYLERGGKVRWLKERGVEVPEGRGEAVAVQLSVPLYSFARESFSRLGIALCSFVLLYFSLTKRYQYGCLCIQLAVLFLGVTHLVEAAGRTIDGYYIGFSLPFLSGVGAFVFAYMLQIRERYFMESITCFSGFAMSLALIEDLAIDPAPERLRDQSAYLVTTLMGAYLVWLRTKSQHGAIRTIAEDERMYAEVWQSIVADPREAEAMAKMPAVLARASIPSSHVVQEMQVALPRRLRSLLSPDDPLRASKERRHSRRASNRSRRDSRASLASRTPSRSAVFFEQEGVPASPSGHPPPSVASSVGSSGEDKSLRGRPQRGMLRIGVSFLTKGLVERSQTQPVRSLSLLYTQAFGLHPLARQKVQAWALLSSAMVPVARLRSGGAEALDAEEGSERGPPQFERWIDIVDTPREQDVKWPELKNPERAIEKLIRTYGGQVCLLQDVVRYSLVFQGAADLLRCLEEMVADPDVQIVEAKNRLRQDYDAWKTAGYRDVHLNLLLKTPVAVTLGLDNHVFELQLQLLPFALCRSAGGHKRYVEFRNALCM